MKVLWGSCPLMSGARVSKKWCRETNGLQAVIVNSEVQLYGKRLVTYSDLLIFVEGKYRIEVNNEDLSPLLTWSSPSVWDCDVTSVVTLFPAGGCTVVGAGAEVASCSDACAWSCAWVGAAVSAFGVCWPRTRSTSSSFSRHICVGTSCKCR